MALLVSQSNLTEFPLMTKGGIRLEVLLNATTRKDEQGNIIGKRLHRSAIFERPPIHWSGPHCYLLFKGVVGIGQDVSMNRQYSQIQMH
jgi:hypothetical protein